MIIGASLGCFRGLTIEPAMELYLKLAKEFDLNAVEIRFEREEGRPSLWYWEDYEISKFLRSFEVKGAHLPFIYLNPISPNSRIREESLLQLRMAIRRAFELGMNYAVMHASGLAYTLTHGQELAEWVEVIEELTRYAEKNGIVLTLENADFLSNLKDIATIVRKVDSKFLRITLDTGHACIRRIPPLSTYPLKELALRALDMTGIPFIIKKYMPYEEYGSIGNFLSCEYDLIFCLHIHDYNGRRDHLSIGSGKIDFSFVSILNKKGFAGPLILEAELKNYREDFEANYERLKSLMDRN